MNTYTHQKGYTSLYQYLTTLEKHLQKLQFFISGSRYWNSDIRPLFYRFSQSSHNVVIDSLSSEDAAVVDSKLSFESRQVPFESESSGFWPVLNFSQDRSY